MACEAFLLSRYVPFAPEVPETAIAGPGDSTDMAASSPYPPELPCPRQPRS